MFTRTLFLAMLFLVTLTALAQPVPAAEEKQPALYDRLGGLMPISVVVSDFIDALVPDATLNANPAIAAARKRVAAAYLKYHVTAMVWQATGGPCIYQGRGMKESHAHLNISEPEWDRMITIFKEVLAKHTVPVKETEELLAIVNSTKADIVAVGGDKWNDRWAGPNCDTRRGAAGESRRVEVHGFENREREDASALSVITPGLPGPTYFQDVADVLNAGGPPDVARIMAVMQKHGLKPAPPV
jgi:hemoglobin